MRLEPFLPFHILLPSRIKQGVYFSQSRIIENDTPALYDGQLHDMLPFSPIFFCLSSSFFYSRCC